MALRKAARLQHRGGGAEALKIEGFADHVGAIATSPQQITQAPLRAELTGADRCDALGLTARAYAPMLALARLLIEAGHDPNRPLHAYRGDVLALAVRSIGEAARLEINAKGTGFAPARAVRTASPARQNAPGVVGLGTDDGGAP